MDPQPFTGFPENPDKKTRQEQIKILIERHNFLVDQVIILEQNFTEKDNNLQEFKQILNLDLENQKNILEQNKLLMRELELLKKIISSEFKQIVKKPIFDKLDKRINGLEYENYILREELFRKI